MKPIADGKLDEKELTILKANARLVVKGVMKVVKFFRKFWARFYPFK